MPTVPGRAVDPQAQDEHRERGLQRLQPLEPRRGEVLVADQFVRERRQADARDDGVRRVDSPGPGLHGDGAPAREVDAGDGAPAHDLAAEIEQAPLEGAAQAPPAAGDGAEAAAEEDVEHHHEVDGGKFVGGDPHEDRALKEQRGQPGVADKSRQVVLRRGRRVLEEGGEPRQERRHRPPLAHVRVEERRVRADVLLEVATEETQPLALLRESCGEALEDRRVVVGQGEIEGAEAHPEPVRQGQEPHRVSEAEAVHEAAELLAGAAGGGHVQGGIEGPPLSREGNGIAADVGLRLEERDGDLFLSQSHGGAQAPEPAADDDDPLRRQLQQAHLRRYPPHCGVLLVRLIRRVFASLAAGPV